MKRTDRVVVITGGTKGIGAAIAKKFRRAKYRIIIGAREDNGIARDLGGGTIFVRTDVREQRDHQALVRTAMRKFGRLDVYVNCAGFSAWKPIGAVTDSFLSEMIDTNLKGVFYGCQAASGAMRRGSCIINISSLAGKRGSANNSVYCATKFAVNGITQALAKELGGRGVRVNAVCPVYVITPGVLQALSDKDSPAAGKDVRKYLEKFVNDSSALGRLPAADDVAETCLFLASGAASAITGQCINIDCGVLPQ